MCCVAKFVVMYKQIACNDIHYQHDTFVNMAGETCHIHDNYTTIHPFDGCKVLTNQSAGNCTTIRIYGYVILYEAANIFCEIIEKLTICNRKLVLFFDGNAAIVILHSCHQNRVKYVLHDSRGLFCRKIVNFVECSTIRVCYWVCVNR